MTLTYSTNQECLDYLQEYNNTAFTAFSELTEQEVNELIANATIIIDNNNFKGIKAEPLQDLEWPRIIKGVTYEVPEKIKFAIFETAYTLFTKIDKKLLTKTGNDASKVKSRSLEGMRIEYFESNSKALSSNDLIPVIASIYLKNYLDSYSKVKTYKIVRG